LAVYLVRRFGFSLAGVARQPEVSNSRSEKAVARAE